MLQFTHLLMEAKSKYSPNIKPYLKTHDILDSVDGFSHIALNYNMLPPIRIKTRPIIFIMKRKPNIQYDPKKASPQTILKQSKKNATKKSIGSKDVINDTVQDMEPILDEIMESLEQFEKPLNTNDANILDVEVPEDELNNKTNKPTELIESLSTEKLPNNISENNLSQLNTLINKENLQTIPDLQNDIMTESNTELQSDVENNSNISEQKLDIKEEENKKIEVAKERLKLDNVQQDSSILKEVVKKLIQEKLEAVKLREDATDEKVLPEIPQKINAKVKRIIPIKIESSQKIKIITKQDLKEKYSVIQELKEKPAIAQEIKEKPVIIKEIKERPMIIQETKEKPMIKQELKEKSALNMKESIRNIINQFKEFEKDFVHEDSEIDKKEFAVKYNEQPTETSTKKAEDLLRIDVMTESRGVKTIKDAKESLRDIINQFKQIKSELTSEEDDLFEKIEATYMERPIAETLMQFSEALKNLVQRRKKSKTFTIDTFENKNDKPKPQILPKLAVGNHQFPTESPKNSKMQNYNNEGKIYNIEKAEKIIRNINGNDGSSQGTNKVLQERYFITYTNNKNVPINAQKSSNSVSNTVVNDYTSNEKDEMMQKKMRNSSN